ncbi:MAG: carbamate kinase [Actinobacteria bacterium]|nr:carbamate kinase [Actinomycetota bacterium]
MSADGRRVLLALGGNAIAPAGSAGTAGEQTAHIDAAMGSVADLVAAGWQVLITHGNGPQVGNLMTKNEVARALVPPVPLDWCVAQTQATIGHTIANTLEHHLAARDLRRLVVALPSRVLVDPGDPAFDEPTKPIGRYIEEEAEVRRRERETKQRWAHQGDRGWRRVVASPEPRASLDLGAVELLHRQGAVVVANGGGGIPTVREADGRLRGIEAVIDKDLSGALLGCELDVDVYVILTDVRGVAVGFGTPSETWLSEIDVAGLRAHQADGQFASGSMGPKVEAVCRFVEQGGRRAAIGALDDIASVVDGTAGTQVTA